MGEIQTAPFIGTHSVSDLKRVIKHWENALKRGDIPTDFIQELKEEVLPELKSLLVLLIKN